MAYVDVGQDRIDGERRCIRNAIRDKTACFHHLCRTSNGGRGARSHMRDLVRQADNELMIRLIPGKGDGHWRPNRHPAQRSVRRVDTGVESLTDNV